MTIGTYLGANHILLVHLAREIGLGEALELNAQINLCNEPVNL